jgi:hypothetical protein
MPTARPARRPKLHLTQHSPSSSASDGVGLQDNPEIAFSSVVRGLWTIPGGMHEMPLTVTTCEERRAYARAKLRLPLRIVRIAGHREAQPNAFLTVDISSSGLLAHLPFEIDPGTPVDLDVDVLPRTISRCTVHMRAQAHAVRVQPSEKSGWLDVAFSFDDITFERGSISPQRFMPS